MACGQKEDKNQALRRKELRVSECRAWAGKLQTGREMPERPHRDEEQQGMWASAGGSVAEHQRALWRPPLHKQHWVSARPVALRVLTTTILCCSWLQCLGRMGRMVGGSRMPSSMWITPLAAGTSTLRSGTPSGPSRMRPCDRAQCAMLCSSPAGSAPPLPPLHLPAALLPSPGQHRSSLSALTTWFLPGSTPRMCSPSSSLQPSQPVGPGEGFGLCCLPYDLHRGLLATGLEHEGRCERAATHHQPLHSFPVLLISPPQRYSPPGPGSPW